MHGDFGSCISEVFQQDGTGSTGHHRLFFLQFYVVITFKRRVRSKAVDLNEGWRGLSPTDLEDTAPQPPQPTEPSKRVATLR
jgi:hypothetical protein